jgi:hypothetical protein
MSFCLSFHQGLLRPTGGDQLDGPLDGPLDLSCKESTRQHALDDTLLSCKQQGGSGASKSASAKLDHMALTA